MILLFFSVLDFLLAVCHPLLNKFYTYLQNLLTTKQHFKYLFVFATIPAYLKQNLAFQNSEGVGIAIDFCTKNKKSNSFS